VTLVEIELDSVSVKQPEAFDYIGGSHARFAQILSSGFSCVTVNED
jgi:hypothetical protein